MGFDWHNFAKIEEPDFKGEDGKSHASDTPAARHYLERSKALTEKVMDQISTIPEVQKLLMGSMEFGSHALLKNDVTERLSDPRLSIILVVGGETSYLRENHTLTLNMLEVPMMAYGRASHPVSLQHALIHELHHAGDPDIKVATETNAASEVQAFGSMFGEELDRNPRLRDQFEKTGKLLGRDPEPLFKAPNLAAFSEAMGDFTVPMTIATPEALAGLKVSTRATSLTTQTDHQIIDRIRKNMERAVGDERVAKDENHVVTDTDKIMSKYYGEPKRVVYEAHLVPGAQKIGDPQNPDYDSLLRRLEKHIHPAINTKAGIPDIEATRIEGVSFERAAASELARHAYLVRTLGLHTPQN